MTIDNANYFCSQKFTHLSVDLEKRLSYSCCAATPENINLQWVAANPGQLFNTPSLQQQRQHMLANKPVSNCSNNCWEPESQGLPSRRIMMATDQPQQLPIHSQPTILNIIVGSTCNLTCVYCCKQYSSAWYRDIDTNGGYLDQDRFRITPIEQVTSKLSQNEHAQSVGFQALSTEISKFDQLQQVEISGGEPFLYNHLSTMINQFSPSIKIELYTGLGIDSTRLQKELCKINNWSNITVYVSAETQHKLYEFVRYGNSFDRFLKNFEILKNHGCHVVIKSVLSNTTILDVVEFQEKFNQYEISYQFCTDPDFLNVNVLDHDTKQQVLHKIKNSSIIIKDQIVQAVEKMHTETQRKNLKNYLAEFATRRKLSLTVFPQSMIEWLQLGEHNVVQ